MPISEEDALAAHAALHGGKSSMTLASGKTYKVSTAKNGCRSLKLPDLQAMEQNKKKSSEWAKKASAGVKITWFLPDKSGNSPSTWGRVVDGKLETRGKAIEATASAAPAPKKGPRPSKEEASAAPKRGPKAKAEAKRSAKAKATPTAAASTASASTDTAVDCVAPKKRPGPAGAADLAAMAPAKKQKLEDQSDASDPLQLAPVFAGMGHGGTWLKILKPVLESLSDAASFIGPSRDKGIIPVRELTFQALKPNLPSGWRVVSLGQSPYPRIESATGIAHFDNSITSWESKKFGSVVTMRAFDARWHRSGNLFWP